jgi:hypothetical protein
MPSAPEGAGEDLRYGVALHSEGTDGNDADRCATRQRLDPPRRVADGAQILLVLDDKNALAHIAPAATAARTGSSMRNVEP